MTPVMDDMVNTESSKLSNGNDNTDSTTTQPKFKRRKIFAVRDFPPGCGTSKTYENGNVRSSVEEVENLGQQNGLPCNDMDVDEEKPEKDECDGLMMVVVAENRNFSENMNDVQMVEPMDVQPVDVQPVDVQPVDVKPVDVQPADDQPAYVQPVDAQPVDVQPLSICLPEGYENLVVASNPLKDLAVGFFDGRSIVRTKKRNARKVSIVRDFPQKTGGTCLNNYKVSVLMGKNLVIEKSGFAGVNGTKNPVMDIVVYTGEPNDSTKEVTKPLVHKKPIVTSSKPIKTAGRKRAKKGVAFHSPLKLSETIGPECGKGSMPKRKLQELEDSQTLEVGIPPSRPNGSSGGESDRNKVKELLRLFHGACRKILQEIEAKPQKKGAKKPRVDFEASKILKSKGKHLNNDKHIIGSVPGIEVGDEFQYRMELHIVGIHKPSQAGIDYMKDGEDIIATSIVASGGYDDELDNSDVLTYTGQGGNVIKVNKKGKEEKEPEDQQLVRGNLALANSVDKKNPVRVIKGNKKAALQTPGNASGGNYVYDGLYIVEEYWQETGSHGKLVFKFKLRRIPGQPELSWKVVKKSTKLKYREGLCKLDISEGKERLPISAVNEIDDEKPPMFTYTVKMIYPDWCKPIPPKACGCTKRCTEASTCTCVAKNGGDIPYNHDGAIVSAKNLIYECGLLCKCPSSCYLRVTQRGIKFQLEIFKTASRGWGVRSLNSIPSGSFICEYAGELLEDKEAERRTGNDEYLFDIGNKYDNSLAEEMSKLMPETRPQEEDDDEETSSGFTIDAAKKGNIGRFINHSCSPNLYAQNVLYDHEDTRIPHVMFFAMDNISPLQELSYHYNYMIDQVRDSNGNIKKKICYCGSSECTGRLY